MKSKNRSEERKKDKKVPKVAGSKIGKKKKSKQQDVEVIKKSIQSDPKSQLELLAKFLKCDYVITVNFGDVMKKSEAKQKFDFLVLNAFHGGLVFPIDSWTKKSAFVGIKIETSGLPADLPQGNVVIGPEADDQAEVSVTPFLSIFVRPTGSARPLAGWFLGIKFPALTSFLSELRCQPLYRT